MKRRELAEVFDFRSASCCGYGFKIMAGPKVDFLAVNSNTREELATSAINHDTTDTATVILADAHILIVLGVVGGTEIHPTLVGWVPIFMVNTMLGPLSGDEKPDQVTGHILMTTIANDPITIGIYMPGWTGGNTTTRRSFPIQRASERIVRQQRPSLFKAKIIFFLASAQGHRNSPVSEAFLARVAGMIALGFGDQELPAHCRMSMHSTASFDQPLRGDR